MVDKIWCVLLYAHSGGYLNIITEHFETFEYKEIMFVCMFVDIKIFGNEEKLYARFLLCSMYTLKHLKIRNNVCTLPPLLIAIFCSLRSKSGSSCMPGSYLSILLLLQRVETISELDLYLFYFDAINRDY